MELYIESTYLSTPYDFDIIKKVTQKWIEEVEMECANCQEFDCYGCKYVDLKREMEECKMIVIINSDKNKIELTPEEFQNYLKQARQEGYDEGYKIGKAEGNVIYPWVIQPYWEPKRNWWDYGITTCSSNTEGIAFANDIKTASTTADKNHTINSVSI